jgi:hypothetical protein
MGALATAKSWHLKSPKLKINDVNSSATQQSRLWWEKHYLLKKHEGGGCTRSIIRYNKTFIC